MCILEEQETYLSRAFLIIRAHSVSCGSVHGSLCWNIPTKSQQQGISSSQANELVATSGSQKKIWISWKDIIEGTDRRKEKESQYKQN